MLGNFETESGKEELLSGPGFRVLRIEGPKFLANSTAQVLTFFDALLTQFVQLWDVAARPRRPAAAEVMATPRFPKAEAAAVVLPAG